MDQSPEEIERIKLEQEQEALLAFLSSDGYKAAQRVNQESIDDNLAALVEIRVTDLGKFFELTDIISDTRTKLNFKTQFTDRLSEIDAALTTKPKPKP